jgi:hypothetical protein
MARASGVDVSILSTAKTPGAVVGRVVECVRPGTRHGEWLARAVVELAVKIIFYLLSGGLEQIVGVGGAGVNPVMDSDAVLGVVVGVKGNPSITNVLEGAKGVTVAFDGLGHNSFVLVVILILDGNGDVICEVVPIRLNTILKRFAVYIDVGVSGRLGDIAGKGVGDVFKWKDGEGIGVMDCTMYDLHVHEETS